MNETEKRDRRDEKEEIRYHVIFYQKDPHLQLHRNHGCKMDEDSAGIGIRFSYPLIRAVFSLFPEFRQE